MTLSSPARPALAAENDTVAQSITLAATSTSLRGEQLANLSVAVHLTDPDGVSPSEALVADRGFTCPCVAVESLTADGKAFSVSPQANPYRVVPLRLVSGTAQDGVWSGRTLVGAINAGVWRPVGIAAGDLKAVGMYGDGPVPIPAGAVANSVNIRGRDWPLLTIARPALPVPGHRIVVTGTARLAQSHGAASTARLVVRSDTCDGAVDPGYRIAATTASAAGAWSVSTYHNSDRIWCVHFGEDATGQEIAEARASGGAVPVYLTARASLASTRVGANVNVTGRVIPGSTSGLGLQRLVGHSWKVVNRNAHIRESGGAYDIDATPPAPGTFRYRVFAGRYTSAVFTISAR